MQAFCIRTVLAHSFHDCLFCVYLRLCAVKAFSFRPVIAPGLWFLFFTLIFPFGSLLGLFAGCDTVQAFSSGGMVAFGSNVACLHFGNSYTMAFLLLELRILATHLNDRSVLEIWDLIEFFALRDSQHFVVLGLED